MQTSPYILNCFIVCIYTFLLILSYTYNLAFACALVDGSVFIFMLVCCPPSPLPFPPWRRRPEPSLPAPCSLSALWVLYLGVGVGFKPWQPWTQTDHFFRKPHLAREACDKSSHSRPPTAKQQRYLCHSASPHLRSGISRCLGLISCRAGGRALLQLSQAEYELIVPASCPTLPSEFKEVRALLPDFPSYDTALDTVGSAMC